eukprot:scaffold68995_cov60-Phaeocystis_antarctica.AAC.2
MAEPSAQWRCVSEARATWWGLGLELGSGLGSGLGLGLRVKGLGHLLSGEQRHASLAQHSLEDGAHARGVLRHHLRVARDERDLHAHLGRGRRARPRCESRLYRQGELDAARAAAHHHEPDRRAAGRLLLLHAPHDHVPTRAEAVDWLHRRDRREWRRPSASGASAVGRLRRDGLRRRANVDGEHVVRDGRPTLEQHAALRDVDPARLRVDQPRIREGREPRQVNVALLARVHARDVARQHARVGRLDVARDEREPHARLGAHAEHLEHVHVRVATAHEHEVLDDGCHIHRVSHQLRVGLHAEAEQLQARLHGRDRDATVGQPAVHLEVQQRVQLQLGAHPCLEALAAEPQQPDAHGAGVARHARRGRVPARRSIRASSAGAAWVLRRRSDACGWLGGSSLGDPGEADQRTKSSESCVSEVQQQQQRERLSRCTRSGI